MTRYSDLQDAGYRAVSDQLWLWVNDIEREIEEEEEKSKAAETAELLPEERREARASGIGSMRGLGGASDSGGSSNGIVSTGRNASFRDNYVTGRDSTINLTK
jgi:hypothetical protein